MIQGKKYIVYDCTIMDISERRLRAVIYESGRKLQDAIGIPQPKIPLYTNPAEKKRYYSVRLRKHFAIRLHSLK